MSDPAATRAVISGVGMSQVGRRLGVPGLDLTTNASLEAIADAGLVAADIDCVLSLGDTPTAEVRAALGIIDSCPGATVDRGGLLAPVVAAAIAVSEHRARHVLVYRTVQMMGGTVISSDGARPTQPTRHDAARANVMGDMDSLLAYHAYSAANWLAMHCQRHMHLYGTTKEQLGALAINSRVNASLNPRATYRDPMTMDDYLNARPVSSPFGLLDCDAPVDGSIAVVVSHEDYRPDCPNPAIQIAAMGWASGRGGWIHREDYPKMASVDAAAEMWRRTDLTPSDIDIAELYDGFTFLTIAWLEALGICGDGEGGPFVEGGNRIALDGELPLNTYGGQLSAGRMHGYWVLHEACVQLRGGAGECQVAGGPEVAVVSAGGGPIAGCLLLTG